MKSHVSLEQHQCPICGRVHDTGNLLLDTRIVNGKLRESMEKYTVTGLSPCPECAERLKDYVAMIVTRGYASNIFDADRTGETLWVKREAWPRIFKNAEIPSKGIAMCDAETCNAVRNAVPHEKAE